MLSAAQDEQTIEQDVERLNRIRDFFGDPTKRWNDRLNLYEKSFGEEYVCGRAALVLHCDVETVSTFHECNTRTAKEELARQTGERSVLFIFKAHISERHK